MTGTQPPASGRNHAGRWRLGLALCASAATHAWLLAALPETRRPHVSAVSVISPRIEAQLVAGTTSGPGIPEAAEPAGDLPHGAPPRRLPAAPASPPVRVTEPSARTLPQPLDLTWYSAHELDTYPRSLAPLRFDHPLAAEAGTAGARLLLWLRIDEHGQVVEVRAGEPGVPGDLVDAARMSLAAIRFTPARKDERAVKSRIQVSIAY